MIAETTLHALWSDSCLAKQVKCKKFIKGAHKFLVPVLLIAMTQQEEDQDADTFNKSTEAAVCLQSIASTINEEILETVIPWVRSNISQPNWRLREASVMAFGCILEGPQPVCLQEFVSSNVENLVNYLNDSTQICKDTSAWTLRQVCQHVPTAINKQLIGRLCETIMAVIPGCEPSTAEHLCVAVMSLAKFVKDGVLEAHGDNWPQVPNEFSTVVVALAQCLVQTGDRPDATEASLRQSAYETLNSVIDVADNQIVQNFVAPQLLPMLGERLSTTFQMQALNADDLNTKSEWQSIYCGTLQGCIARLPASFLVIQDATGSTLVDRFMGLFLQVGCNPACSRPGPYSDARLGSNTEVWVQVGCSRTRCGRAREALWPWCDRKGACFAGFQHAEHNIGSGRPSRDRIGLQSTTRWGVRSLHASFRPIASPVHQRRQRLKTQRSGNYYDC